jgi:hypothetical protein
MLGNMASMEEMREKLQTLCIDIKLKYYNMRKVEYK